MTKCIDDHRHRPLVVLGSFVMSAVSVALILLILLVWYP